MQTTDEVLAELDGGAHRAKKAWGSLTETWVRHDVRGQVADFVRRRSEKTEISAGRFISWLGVTVASSTTGGSAKDE